MDEATRSEYETKAKELRHDLKIWETEWAKTHGKKPGRDDIKRNADIGKCSYFSTNSKAASILTARGSAKVQAVSEDARHARWQDPTSFERQFPT